MWQRNLRPVIVRVMVMVRIRVGVMVTVRVIKNAMLLRDLFGVINHKGNDGYILIYVLVCKYNDVIE